MRISDWSSDVCSSDLALARFVAGALHEIAYARVAREVQRGVVLRLAATNAQVARQPERAHPVHQAEVDRLGSAALVGGHVLELEAEHFRGGGTVDVGTRRERRQQAGVLGQVSHDPTLDL